MLIQKLCLIGSSTHASLILANTSRIFSELCFKIVLLLYSGLEVDILYKQKAISVSRIPNFVFDIIQYKKTFFFTILSYPLINVYKAKEPAY